MLFKIWRSGKDGSQGRYEAYEVDVSPDMSILEALFQIRDRVDDSLAFRYSCRGAICGSCAMTINREPRLACRTQVNKPRNTKPMGLRLFPPLEEQVEWDRKSEVLVEPLPNLPILKDLVVDMSPFFSFYEKVQPWIAQPESEEFSVMTQEQVDKVDRYADCILCASCFGSCPVCFKDREYLGPAALAWALRFVDDPRTSDKKDRFRLASVKGGAPSCEFVYNCVKVCPKNVAPAGAIRILKEYLAKDSEAQGL